MRSMKSVEQGAATTVWAAVSKDLEGRGGRYLENCSESAPVKNGYHVDEPGYVATAFNEDAEKRCWKMTCDLVEIENSDF